MSTESSHTTLLIFRSLTKSVLLVPFLQFLTTLHFLMKKDKLNKSGLRFIPCIYQSRSEIKNNLNDLRVITQTKRFADLLKFFWVVECVIVVLLRVYGSSRKRLLFRGSESTTVKKSCLRHFRQHIIVVDYIVKDPTLTTDSD